MLAHTMRSNSFSLGGQILLLCYIVCVFTPERSSWYGIILMMSNSRQVYKKHVFVCVNLNILMNSEHITYMLTHYFPQRLTLLYQDQYRVLNPVCSRHTNLNSTRLRSLCRSITLNFPKHFWVSDQDLSFILT